MKVGVFLAGLLTGTALGILVMSHFTVNARGIEGAEKLADEIARDEKLERDFSG